MSPGTVCLTEISGKYRGVSLTPQYHSVVSRVSRNRESIMDITFLYHINWHYICNELKKGLGPGIIILFL